jgi:hypothetical protein
MAATGCLHTIMDTLLIVAVAEPTLATKPYELRLQRIESHCVARHIVAQAMRLAISRGTLPARSVRLEGRQRPWSLACSCSCLVIYGRAHASVRPQIPNKACGKASGTVGRFTAQPVRTHGRGKRL